MTRKTRRARLAPKRSEGEAPIERGCPWPHKRRFVSRTDAAVEAARLRSVDAEAARVSPYLCTCTSWHLGNSTGSWSEQARDIAAKTIRRMQS